MRRWFRPVLAYLAAAVVTTWPLALHPRALLGAPVGPGDPYLNLWIAGWAMQALLAHPAALFNGGIFNANIFYPATGTLAYSDHLLLQSVLLAPLYAVTHDAVLCYNVLLIASLVASALAMHVFARAITGSEPGSYIAGLAWGFGAYRFAHLIHLQLQSLYFLPLTFLYLHRVIAGRRTRDVVLLGLMAALQAISSVYYGIIGSLALVVGGLTLAAAVGRWRNVAVLRRLVVAGAIAGVLVAPVAVVYARVAQREGFGRNLYEAAQNAARLSSYVHVPPGNVLYARTGLLQSQNPEREAFPGLVLMALALVGAWRGWRSDAKPAVMAMGAIAALGFVLSLGPDGVRPFYATVHRFVFGFAAIRAPARFAVLVDFAMCVLGAIGFREIFSARTVRVSRHKDFYGDAVFVLLIAEMLHMPLMLAAAPPQHTAVGKWLAGAPGAGAVALLPIGLDVDATPAMVQSLEHRRPIVNGYSGQRPDFYRPLAEAINMFPSEEALAALHDSRVRFVVTRTPLDRVEPPVVERARTSDGTIYELAWTPELESRLSATATIDPPPPGTIPFRVGELAQYRVNWGGAGVTVSAGDISMGVEGPPYRFVVKAATAPWVARFFEAQDVFTTQSDGKLLPQVHERDQNEGSRHVTRAFVFDEAAHVVRTGRTAAAARAEGAVTLPMAPKARDAVSALFYVRSLPLMPGYRARFPVNDAGRNLVVELAVDGAERVNVAGMNMDALRVTPTIQRGVDDRRALTSTIWLSNDARRLPLILDLDAGFGRLHVELVSYAP